MFSYLKLQTWITLIFICIYFNDFLLTQIWVSTNTIIKIQNGFVLMPNGIMSAINAIIPPLWPFCKATCHQVAAAAVSLLPISLVRSRFLILKFWLVTVVLPFRKKIGFIHFAVSFPSEKEDNLDFETTWKYTRRAELGTLAIYATESRKK